MPDISVLVEMAEYFEIDILELINGERKGKEVLTEKSIEQVVDYAGKQQDYILRRVLIQSIVGFITFWVGIILGEIYRAIGGNYLLVFQPLFLGITVAMLSENITYILGINRRMRELRKKYKILWCVEIILLIILLIWLGVDTIDILKNGI